MEVCLVYIIFQRGEFVENFNLYSQRNLKNVRPKEIKIIGMTSLLKNFLRGGF